MVREDRFKGSRALTERMINLNGVRGCRKTINNPLVARDYRTRRILKKPLLTANHCQLRRDWARRWQKMTVAARSHLIWGDESRFQQYPVNGHMRVRRLPGERFQQDCQADRVQAGGSSVRVCGAFHRGAKSPLVRYERQWRGVSEHLVGHLGTIC